MRPLFPYRFWNRIRNSGDAITAYLLRDLANVEPVLVGPDVPHLLATGSILFMHTPKSIFWGCGVMDPSMGFPAYPASRFSAVRGKLTYQWLKEKGIALDDIPLGDPGMLVSRLGVAGGSLKEWADLPPRWRAAVVPHWTHFGLPKFQRYEGSSEVALVDMRDSSLKPLETIARSEIVISESLHGLIFAEALGKPSLWIGRSDPKWTWKFHDWYSNSENAPEAPLAVDAFKETDFKLAERRTISSSFDDLLGCFPFDKVKIANNPLLLPFDQCRQRAPEVIITDTLSGVLEKLPVDEWTRKMREIFKAWAEPVYWGVAKKGDNRPSIFFNLMINFLDQDRLIKVCCLSPKSILSDYPHLEGKVENFRGATIIRGVALCELGALFRDTTPFTVSDENKHTITATLLV